MLFLHLQIGFILLKNSGCFRFYFERRKRMNLREFSNTKSIRSFIYKRKSKVFYIPYFSLLKGGKSQMKKGDKEMGIWGANLISAILSGFGMGLEGEVIGYYEA